MANNNIIYILGVCFLFIFFSTDITSLKIKLYNWTNPDSWLTPQQEGITNKKIIAFRSRVR